MIEGRVTAKVLKVVPKSKREKTGRKEIEERSDSSIFTLTDDSLFPLIDDSSITLIDGGSIPTGDTVGTQYPSRLIVDDIRALVGLVVLLADLVQIGNVHMERDGFDCITVVIIEDIP